MPAPSASAKDPIARAVKHTAGGSSAPVASLRSPLTIEQYVNAGLANIVSSCRHGWWPTRLPVESILGLSAADPQVVDLVICLQQRLGLPVTGQVDEATWVAFQREAAARTGEGLRIRGAFNLDAPAASLPVRLCGGRVARHGTWSATAAETRSALAARDATPARRTPITVHPWRNTVSVLGRRQRTGNTGTEVFGLTFGQVLQACVWNRYVAALAPGQSTVYSRPDDALVGLRVRPNVPRPLTRLSGADSPILALWVAQWELTKGWAPKGMFTARISSAIREEMRAGTDWGRRFSLLIMFSSEQTTRPQVDELNARRRAAAQRGTRSDGVVSNLQPKLVGAQASGTEKLRLATQVQRDQYAREQSLTASSKGLVAQWKQDVGNSAAAAGRGAMPATGGRGGFVTPTLASKMANPVFDFGGPLVRTSNPTGQTPAGDATNDSEIVGTAQTPAGEVTNDSEIVDTTADVAFDSSDPGAGTPGTPIVPEVTATRSGGSGGGSEPSAFNAGNAAWSSASAADIERARGDDSEDAWAFDGSAAQADVPVVAGPQEVANIQPAGAPPATTAPRRNAKGVFLFIGVAAGLFFLLRSPAN